MRVGAGELAGTGLRESAPVELAPVSWPEQVYESPPVSWLTGLRESAPVEQIRRRR